MASAAPATGPATGPTAPSHKPKTLIVCCDGTWVNATAKASRNAPPTNISRLIRVLQPTSHDGGAQIALYHAGVGSSGEFVDASLGGAFGFGLDQDIRDLYQFVCLNYHGGDRIVLAGFSRGAFTARSVADLIASVGLLTAAGVDRFYDIFDDYENMADPKRTPQQFICPVGTLEAFAGQKGEAWIEWENRRKTQYRAWLKAGGYTVDSYRRPSESGSGSEAEAEAEVEIRIAAVAVWDTVGELGIPAVPVLGLHGSARQWKFTNTQISAKVENAFQALALDEPRYAFLPSLWERLPGNDVTNLQQVWFPGAHSNVGGGYADQQLANLTLAWMCDQLSGVGLAFDESMLAEVFIDGLRYSAVHPYPQVPLDLAYGGLSGLSGKGAALVSSLFSKDKRRGELARTQSRRSKGVLPWANAGVMGDVAVAAARTAVRDKADCPSKYLHNHPTAVPADLWARGARSWALGQSRKPTSLVQRAGGLTVRKPAQFVRVDPASNIAQPDQPLVGTNERIHASVRVRLSCGGLSMDDKTTWTCKGLTGRKPLQDDFDDGGSSSDVSSSDDGHDAPPLWTLKRVDGVADVGNVGGSDAGAEGGAYYPLSKVAGAGTWQWVYTGHPVRPKQFDVHSNNQMSTAPVARVLPEALPTGRWERLLLGLTVGKPDVLAWAAANPYKNA
ncbi:hypothetical protein HMPREF1624_07620 [Sporothrix schenckii ATCC 58251]|uniref:T6SS Phospholipase effector Tle1-like catalytic domain-containing protein n=1 Tax=Sporothrix schenckii (strain ATCC 58251 / de Perez 2211183) TaxID=1391915 RepID=U7PMW5_SPOS1|nr:hypothetical protein HMPREF1624_07620 [Sporothrix schenckii ATCC 58251]